jgi:hypothetical protein
MLKEGTECSRNGAGMKRGCFKMGQLWTRCSNKGRFEDLGQERFGTFSGKRQEWSGCSRKELELTG